MKPEERKALRKSKIAARDGLTSEERMELSEKIVKNILESEAFRKAETVLIYRGIRGEVRLDSLESAAEAKGKKLLFPLCISSSEMIAMLPEDDDSWKEGYCGIQEPVREKSQEIPPDEIDLIICPCTVFDENCGRMGMGAGFYDRYLEKCSKAVVAAAAFEIQKVPVVPVEPWDKPMDMIFTEKRIYVRE